ncbi:hypothetical protein D6858_11205 [Tsuneonella suprasediminis]|uniref:Uncharacterized protein n=1 Tax=Tsuneonella suprasediminis TaxID=2306996 RepID=A0A419R0D9_9SPHN|nr:hypothetical protein [Tsuneonella suprasediminis]RJX66914.1 hypothetical protein D6858_11205 [Tsuneonella suprasediminis]
MSGSIDDRMFQDRIMRDAAKAVVMTDIANIKADLAARSVGDRVADRISDSALGVFEEAIEVADNNKGALAALLGAIALWFARNPIVALFVGEEDGDNEDEGDDDILVEEEQSSDHTR